MNGSTGEWLFCNPLSITFFSNGSSGALEEHNGDVSIGGRNITNLRFADDIDVAAEEEQE